MSADITDTPTGAPCADSTAAPAASPPAKPRTKLDHALACAARRWPVFPLRPDSKVPAFDRGHLDATTDPDTICAWWSDVLTGAPLDRNIGVRPVAGAWMVADLDVKNGVDGPANYEAAGGAIDGVVTQTPSGGYHVFLAGPDIATTAGRIAPGVDTRSSDGYVVGPGSTINGKAYELIADGAMLPVPAFILERVPARSERTTSITYTAVENDQPRNLARFADVCRRAPPAVAGNWHDASRDLACEAVRCAVSIEMALEIMRTEWVPRGSGFADDGRADRWPADVANSYQWALRDGEHGAHSVDAQCEAFNGVVVVPPPDAGIAVVEAAKPGVAGPAWRFTVPTSLRDRPVPVREFIVDQWLSPGHVTILYGEGGTGKSLLAMQLMTAAATGRHWCGMPVTHCRTVGLFCEDDDAELHRRQARVNAAMGVGFSDLGNMAWASGVGADNTLITFDRDGIALATPAFSRLLTEARRFAARLVVVDTAADTFGGNENDRRQVRQFLGAALGRLALELNAAVLLTAHPSRAGRNTGDLDGGSTAWSNTARARWAMSRPEGREGEVDPDLRVLSRRKANYAAMGDTVRIRYQDGAFVVPTPLTGDQWRQHQFRAQATFLALLNRVNLEGREASASKQSSNYAPAMFAKRSDRDGFLRADFEDAMGHLLMMGNVEILTGGKASRPSRFLRPVTGMALANDP